MNLTDVENLLGRMKECVYYYKKTFLDNKVFTLFLGNGEKVKYSINPVNLPHLLGLNLYNLKKYITFKSEDSIEIMYEVCERYYEVYKLIANGTLKQEEIFSRFAENKINNFKSNLKSDAKDMLEETEFVCSYSSQKSWEVTTKNQKYDYIIVKKFDDKKVGLLCLVKNGMKYYAMSNQVFDNTEEAKKTLEELITNQEITLLTGVNVYNTYSDSNFNRSLTTNQKLEKIDDMRYYKTEYGCYIDISSDYEYTIERLRDNKEEKFENRNIVDEIVEAILNKKLIPRNEDSDLTKIIDAWNDHICISADTTQKNTGVSYTDAIKDLNTFRNLAEALSKEKENLNAEISALTSANETLEKENDEYKIKQEATIEYTNAIMKILKPEN